MLDSRWRRHERLVQIGERAFLVRPPTLETICRAFEYLGPALESLMEFREKFREIPEEDRPGAVALLLAVYPECSRVLESCAELIGGNPGDFEKFLLENPDARKIIMATAIGLADTDAILARFLPSLTAETEEDSRPATDYRDEFDISLLRAAHILGCSPFDFYEWPAGAALFALERAPLLLMSPGEEIETIDGAAAPPVVLQSFGINVLRTKPAEA